MEDDLDEELRFHLERLVEKYVRSGLDRADAVRRARMNLGGIGQHGHAGAEYVLTGPESLTQREQISIVGSVLGRSLRIEEMTPDEARRELVSVMNWGMAPATSV